MEISSTVKFRQFAESKGMTNLELMAFIDGFHWFPRTYNHCSKTYRGRNLKANGYKGFTEYGTTYNMDIVYAYVEEHNLGLNSFLKELDELSIARDEMEIELEHERMMAA